MTTKQWNDLKPGDIQVSDNGTTRTVEKVSEVPGGFNWIDFTNGMHGIADGGEVTIQD